MPPLDLLNMVIKQWSGEVLVKCLVMCACTDGHGSHMQPSRVPCMHILHTPIYIMNMQFSQLTVCKHVIIKAMQLSYICITKIIRNYVVVIAQGRGQ